MSNPLMPLWLSSIHEEIIENILTTGPITTDVDDDACWSLTLYPALGFLLNGEKGYDPAVHVQLAAILDLFEEVHDLTVSSEAIYFLGEVGGENDVEIEILFDPPSDVEPSFRATADGYQFLDASDAPKTEPPDMNDHSIN